MSELNDEDDLNDEDELRQINSDLAWWQEAFPRVLGFTYRIRATIPTTCGGTVEVSSAFRNDIVAQLAAAREAERERCAVLIAKFDIHEDVAAAGASFCHDAPSRVFAAAIRKGQQP